MTHDLTRMTAQRLRDLSAQCATIADLADTLDALDLGETVIDLTGPPMIRVPLFWAVVQGGVQQPVETAEAVQRDPTPATRTLWADVQAEALERRAVAELAAEVTSLPAPEIVEEQSVEVEPAPILPPAVTTPVEPDVDTPVTPPKPEPRAKTYAPSNGAEWTEADDARILQAVKDTPEHASNVIARRVAPAIGRTMDAVAYRMKNKLRAAVDQIRADAEPSPVQRPSRLTMMRAQAQAMQKAASA